MYRRLGLFLCKGVYSEKNIVSGMSRCGHALGGAVTA